MPTKRDLTPSQLEALFPGINKPKIATRQQMDALRTRVNAGKMAELRTRVGRYKREMQIQRWEHAAKVINSMHPMDWQTLRVYPTLRNIVTAFGSMRVFADACELLGDPLPKSINVSQIDRTYAMRNRAANV